MKVKLERTITDHTTGRRFNVYRREDGRYWVLATPTNPDIATDANVTEHVLDTQREALAFCAKALHA